MIVRSLESRRQCGDMDCSADSTFEVLREDGRVFLGVVVGWHGSTHCDAHLVKFLNLFAQHDNDTPAQIDSVRP